MRLIINFDLIEKIKETKNGFSLKKTSENIIGGTILFTPFLFFYDAVLFETMKITVPEVILNLSSNTFIFGTADLLFLKKYKEYSADFLKRLSIYLKCLNINTNYELLLNSRLYHKQYKINFTKLPKLEEKKYIIINNIENNQVKELSILQEHIIGTKKYILSINDVDKLLKLTPNKNNKFQKK